MTTMVPSHLTMPYGVKEAHVVCFQHRSDRGGVSNAVAVMIPEGAASFDAALEKGRTLRARVILVCDTAEQAGDARRHAQPLLPDHREVAWDRIEAAAWRLDA